MQQVACSLIITLLALYQPYKKKFLNYVDILIFTDLAIINCLNHYLFEVFRYHETLKSPPYYSLVIQYVLIFLPLVYILLYMVLMNPVIMIQYKKWIKRWQKRELDTVAKSDYSALSNTIQPVKAYTASEEILARAEGVNRYKAPKVTVVNVNRKKSHGEADIQSGKSSSEVDKEKIGIAPNYGSIN